MLGEGSSEVLLGFVACSDGRAEESEVVAYRAEEHPGEIDDEQVGIRPQQWGEVGGACGVAGEPAREAVGPCERQPELVLGQCANGVVVECRKCAASAVAVAVTCEVRSTQGPGEGVHG